LGVNWLHGLFFFINYFLEVKKKVAQKQVIAQYHCRLLRENSDLRNIFQNSAQKQAIAQLLYS